jgi:hypothetical protein
MLKACAGALCDPERKGVAMNATTPGLAERLGLRSARVAVLVSGLLFLILTTGWAAVQLLAAVRSGQGLRAVLIGAAALLTLAIWLRVMSVNWRANARGEAPDDAPPELSDATGVWGVGGPSMRDPGTTGNWQRPLIDRRRHQGSDDEEN